MNTKLTLSLDNSVVKNAKIYAKNHRTSISMMTERYLKSICTDEKENIDLSPLVRELSGIITIDEASDIKEEYSRYLTRKYSR